MPDTPSTTPSVRVPSLNHLRDFTRARGLGLTTHVARDREQITATTKRFQSFCYEKLITAIINYINFGCRGGALDQAVFNASDRMRDSYDAAARGVKQTLTVTPATAAQRRQRNIVVPDGGGTIDLVSLRVHLMMRLLDGRLLGTFIHFPAKPLTEPEVQLVETAITLALRSVDHTADPAIWFVRTGRLHVVDAHEATRPERIAFLRDESEAYRQEWALTA